MTIPTELGLNNTPDRFQPSFHMFPIQNNRSGYKPWAMPIVLVVPFSTEGGSTLPFDIKYSIEDAPSQALVAGVEHKGILVPQYERYNLTLSTVELLNLQIDTTGVLYYRLSNGVFTEIDRQDAISGDYIEITLENNTKSKLIYYSDATYYDLSGISITTLDLPSNRYRFTWSARYYKRSSLNDQFVCMTEEVAATATSMIVACPGEVHLSMASNTPAVYFENGVQPDNKVAYDDQSVIKMYRPLADALQDIFDEQQFIRAVNWIDVVPAQLLPYLSYLIGLDLPNFPGVSDTVRKAIVKNGVKLQRLKGTKRAIRELFEIFGFTVNLINTWYLSDGSGFVAPGEQLPPQHAADEIGLQTICQYDILLNDYNIEGFGQIEVPLLYRPNSENVTLHAYLVRDGSASHTALLSIVDSMSSDLNALNTESCSTDVDGFYTPVSITARMPNEVINGFGQVLVNRRLGAISDTLINSNTISKNSIKFDFDTSVVNLNFDGYQDFVAADGSALKMFVFAQYSREQITLPSHLSNLRSNRFDIDITFKDGEIISSNLFDFLINYVIKFKAFHSLIRKIRFNADFSEIYNVLDFCVGGEYQQEPSTDAGELQVPPAVIPTSINTCGDLVDRGFKDEDLEFRKKVLDGLEAEFERWKAIDKNIPDEQRPLLQSLSNIVLNSNSESCGEVKHGQDRVLFNQFDKDHDEDARETLCDLNNNTKNYCYKGRVEDVLINDKIISLIDYVSSKPCHLAFGSGRYYELKGIGNISRIDLTIAGKLQKALKDWKTNSLFQLYFSNREVIGDILEAYLTPAITNRYSLEITLPYLHFPGHRFPSIGNLKTDVTHSVYNARPWDDAYSETVASCKGDSILKQNLLNARLVDDGYGNEDLVYDTAPLIYYGNGIDADISSLGAHESRPYQVTHSLYSTAGEGILSDDGYPVCTLDCTTLTNFTAIRAEKLYDSWNENCGIDYIDGYPAEINYFSYNPDDHNYHSDGKDIDVETILGLPTREPGSTGEISLLFKLCSGIICNRDDSTAEPL